MQAEPEFNQKDSILFVIDARESMLNRAHEEPNYFSQVCEKITVVSSCHGDDTGLSSDVLCRPSTVHWHVCETGCWPMIAIWWVYFFTAPRRPKSQITSRASRTYICSRTWRSHPPHPCVNLSSSARWRVQHLQCKPHVAHI